MLNFDWSIFWTFFNLLVLLVLLKKFLFGPITKIMESRKAEIENSLKDAAEKTATAAQLQAQYSQQLEAAQGTAAQIVAQAKERGKQEYDKLLSAAKTDGEKAMEQARSRMAQEKAQMLQEAKAGLADIVLLTAAKLSEKELDNASSRQAVSAFLAETGVES